MSVGDVGSVLTPYVWGARDQGGGRVVPHLLAPTPGLGLALNFQPSLIMLNRYFNKRRPMANGLAAAGSPVFLCALSPLGQLLQDQYGWRGGFLILGGLLLNCCVCAALMRPLEAPAGSAPASGPQRPSRRLLDLSVFRDRGFVVYAAAASVMVLGLFVPPVFVVSYAKDLGVPDTRAAFLLTVLGLVDIFARPAAGFVTGLPKVRPYSVYLFSFAMFFNGFTDLTGSTASDYGGLVVFCIFFGISYGMVGALQFEVLMAIVGTQKFSSAIGLVLLLEAIAVLIGPPSGGEGYGPPRPQERGLTVGGLFTGGTPSPARSRQATVLSSTQGGQQVSGINGDPLVQCRRARQPGPKAGAHPNLAPQTRRVSGSRWPGLTLSPCRQAPGCDARVPVRVHPGWDRGAGRLPGAGAGQLLLHQEEARRGRGGRAQAPRGWRGGLAGGGALPEGGA